ncbi:hypothetical protein RJ640_014691 [Escallonia rubra]|uniref:non-specific serine/threonine protein kinase n=1 Tax=Escallonia rubra TaxID=112253 RepID=A0AA88UM72_9ASTE|nr:hypothetical protein RJ640_014691 [Escallonia rubra]
MALLYTGIHGNSVKSSNSACPSFDCGNGLVIGYPFWQQSHQPDHCGYPGFNISCTGQTPFLHLSDHLYRVKSIDYPQNSLVIAYGELNDTICPLVSHGVTINSTLPLLNYTGDDKTVNFFYNCTLYPPSVQYIKCLQYGAKRAYVFMDGAIPEFDWRSYCESIVRVPVIGKAAGDDGAVLADGFGGALQDGFKLTWSADRECQTCEASGGFCGHGGDGVHRKFFCFCGDGRQLASCHDAGTLIFGSLMITSTVVFLIGRKKIGAHKRGFSQIPSSGR